MIEIQVLVFGELDRGRSQDRQAKLTDMAKQGWMIAGVAPAGTHSASHHVYMQRVTPEPTRWGVGRDGVTWRERPPHVEWVGDPIPAGGGSGNYHGAASYHANGGNHGEAGGGYGGGTDAQAQPDSAAGTNGGCGGGADASPQGCTGNDT